MFIADAKDSLLAWCYKSDVDPLSDHCVRRVIHQE